MTHLEMVEKLRSITGLSYEEAKNILERNEWDILDAMIELEREGKAENGAAYSTPEKKPVYFKADAAEKRGDGPFRRAFRWCWELLKKSCRNSVAAVRRGETILELPILVFIILVCACFWVVIPAMIVGLFFDLRYTIHGPDTSGTKAAETVSAVSDKAADLAGIVADKVVELKDRVASGLDSGDPNHPDDRDGQ